MSSKVTTHLQPVTFTINEQTYNVISGEAAADFSLAHYIRDRAGLTGTKIMCSQAGCGACVVTAEVPDPASGEYVVKSVNSCVTPILSCDGWHITTVEGLGNKRHGMHPIQSRLAAFHGTQCGYCSPGMVMQMNSLMERNPKATMQQVEDILDGNLCRCTGYRPIFDAFKSMASDATPDLTCRIPDIEEPPKICPKTREPCGGKCGGGSSGKSAIGKQHTANGDWYMPQNLDDLLAVINQLPAGAKYRLVAGNTGTGIYNEDGPYVAYIDVKKVAALTLCKTSPTLELGGGMNLHDVIATLESLATKDKAYFYGKDIGAHLRKVANTAVRHMGTLAGNLMLKHAHNDFPSDIFVMMEAVGASIVTVSAKDPTKTQTNKPSDWLKLSMDRHVILKLILPKLDPESHVFRSFKITPRSQNAHAYVNAAFLINVNKKDNFLVKEKPNCVYGGISGAFIHATKTENYLVGKHMNKIETLRGATAILADEVHPDVDHLLAKPEYRRHLTQALLYKFTIAVLGDQADPSLRSGATQIPRHLSSGKQAYVTDETMWPISKPIAKIEGQAQCTGEAEYMGDLAPAKGELHLAFVITTMANCDLDVVDPSEALKIPGVIAYYDHKDLPGTNNSSFFETPEEIFVTSHVSYAGQAVGIIVAETAELARKAAKAVKITYKNHNDIILSIREAMEKDKSRITGDLNTFFGHKPGPARIGDYDEVTKESDLRVIEGTIEIGSQYQFYMETLTCLVRPIEDGQYEVYCTTQWMHMVQSFIASALNIQKNKIDMKVRRIGGGYGGKSTPTQMIGPAVALAAHKLNRPIRMVMDLKTNMEMFGKRLPYMGVYKVGVNPEGILRYVDLGIYCTPGFNINAATVGEGMAYAQNAYSAAAWNVVPYAVVTDTAANTYCRAPGTTQCHNIIECVMDHIANQLGMDPIELRMKNFLKDGDNLLTGKVFNGENPLPVMIQKLRETSNYDQRKADIDQFNKANKWRKRGIALVPCKYNINYFPLPAYCHISVYEGDGTVAVSTGGIEMGQGLNTKVAAAVAKELGIPMEMISVKPADNFVEPNNIVTGGSMTSEVCVHAARTACQKLKERMATIASNMQNAKWHELVTACFYQGVDLCVRHMGNTMIDGIQDYFIWGCVVTEVELDLLTGEKKVVRTDILEDTGVSLSPEVDIGQIEGAFLFGLGLWLQEEIKHDPMTGKILTYDTWEYKPPASMDIPEDLRVTLYEWDRNSGRGVLGSKATGEPAVHMGVSCALALRRAIDAGRLEILKKDPKDWYSLAGPATVEKTQLITGITSDHFTL